MNRNPSAIILQILLIQINRFIYFLCKVNWSIGLAVRVFANGLGDRGSIPGRVIPKTQKMVLDPSLLNSIIRKGSRVMWSNPEKGVVPTPILQCSSYWKGSLRVTLDCSRQLYFTYLFLLVSAYLRLCQPLRWWIPRWMLGCFVIRQKEKYWILSNPFR